MSTKILVWGGLAYLAYLILKPKPTATESAAGRAISGAASSVAGAVGNVYAGLT